MVHNSALLTMQSPIRRVMAYLHRALVNIAPERDKEFDSVYADFDLEYVDSPRWICSVDTATRHIRVSRRVVEVMWCASYAYTVFYVKKVQGKGMMVQRSIDLHSDPEVAPAMMLLQWAYENWMNGADTLWPAELPHPVESPEQGSFAHVADELCLCAMAYILHHELAHIRLGHIAGRIGLEEERDADYSAADWVMHSSLRQDDPKFVKRALGIAVALEVMVTRGVHTGNFDGITHPPSYDRMVHTLQRVITDVNHLAWCVVAATLKIHLDNSRVAIPDRTYTTFMECVEDYADVLANHARR